MSKTKDDTIQEITRDYLNQIDLHNPPLPQEIQSDILENIKIAFDAENSVREKGNKWRIPERLHPVQIAEILLKLHNIANIACTNINTESEYDLLCVYQTDGENEGIYSSNEQTLHLLARNYCYTISKNEMQEVIYVLKDHATRRARNTEKHLIAVNNGIFNYDTKELLPFSPDYVFLAKSKVNYNLAAQNVVIHNDEDNTDWDVESWMQELSDDTEITTLLWQIMGAIIRPNVSWNKSAWFYSNTGNNGKGTLCELMRQIAGNGSHASISLADFSKDFMLEPLTRATSIIVDENDVGTFIDKAANLKAVITGDVIVINRKFKQPIAYQFRGFMVQCLNEMPRIRDKSDSFYRRQLFVPFTKCFTGKERKYIKDDYLHRREVLEYVLYKVLNMDYYQLSEPDACKTALEEYKEFNDPIRQFVDEILPEATWTLLPFPFLYDLYKAWFSQNIPGGNIQGRNTFITDIIDVIKDSDTWYCQGQRAKIWTGSHMNAAEPLIAEYDLKNWMTPGYTGNDIQKKCHPPDLKNNYRGLLRY